MEGKNRTVFALLVAVIIAAAVLSSFGMNFLGGTPPVALPELSDSGGELPEPTVGAQLGDYVKIELTPETVQGVIVTLARPESYSRTVTIETFGANNVKGTTTAQVLVDGGWTKVVSTLPNRSVEHSLVGADYLYLWRGGERSWKVYGADSLSADLAQRVPTYEDVLAIEKAAIRDTRYEERGGLDCIYVEVAQDELGYLERYWVAVATGLLVSAETVKGEETVYRMSAYEVVVPAPPGSRFELPDGTVLHTVGG